MVFSPLVKRFLPRRAFGRTAPRHSKAATGTAGNQTGNFESQTPKAWSRNQGYRRKTPARAPGFHDRGSAPKSTVDYGKAPGNILFLTSLI
jgi:hypothetical protein